MTPISAAHQVANGTGRWNEIPLVVSDTSWMSSGSCRDYLPAVFFPTDGIGVRAARQVCSSCPVREACLDYAIYCRIEHGVWGGESERARRRIAQARRRKSAS
jgi:WhiB family redox-sensing transcriptional regulator